MNHELAKQLKDAGFPMDTCEARPFYFKDAIMPDEDRKIWMPCPNLEELIEACGDKEYFILEHGADWHASWSKRVGEIGSISEVGSTPTEAVARLWLALNPPK